MSKIGFALTASHCSFDKVYDEIQKLVDLGHEIVPIASERVVTTDTRFKKAIEVVKKLEEITKKEVVSTIVEAEKFGSIEPLDILVIAPATGNTLSKLLHGHTDSAVIMAAKATLRNNSPVVIAFTTNDGLGANGVNIMELLNRKNIYLVPFGQDNFKAKPQSLSSHFDLIIPTIEEALQGRQLQPVLQEFKNE